MTPAERRLEAAKAVLDAALALADEAQARSRSAVMAMEAAQAVHREAVAVVVRELEARAVGAERALAMPDLGARA